MKRTWVLDADNKQAGMHYDVLMAWLVGLRDQVKGIDGIDGSIIVRAVVGMRGQIKRVTVIADGG